VWWKESLQHCCHCRSSAEVAAAETGVAQKRQHQVGIVAKPLRNMIINDIATRAYVSSPEVTFFFFRQNGPFLSQELHRCQQRQQWWQE